MSVSSVTADESTATVAIDDAAGTSLDSTAGDVGPTPSSDWPQRHVEIDVGTRRPHFGQSVLNV